MKATLLTLLLCGIAAADFTPEQIKRFDWDRDGKLNETEKAKAEKYLKKDEEKKRAWQAYLLRRFDKNKNGKLDKQEKVTAELTLQREKAAHDKKVREYLSKMKAEEAAKKDREELKRAVSPPARERSLKLPKLDRRSLEGSKGL